MEELENAVLEAIKLHIQILVDTEKILEQMNHSRTKKIADENMENMKQEKEKEIHKLRNLKRCLYEDWKNNDITREEYLEYKEKYEQDIEKIKEMITNLDKQKEKQEEIYKYCKLHITNDYCKENMKQIRYAVTKIYFGF